MKKLFCFSLVLFYLINVSAQDETKNFKQNLNRLIKINYYNIDSNKKVLLSVTPGYSDLDSSDVLFDFTVRKYNYTYTLLTYALRNKPQDIPFKSLGDTIQLFQQYKDSIIDKLLNCKDYLLAFKSYLCSRNGIHNNDFPRYDIKLDTLITMASRYYGVYTITENNDVITTFCGGGFNPYNLRPELSKNIIAEAFAFEALVQYKRKKEFNLIDKLDKEIRPKLNDLLKKMDSNLSKEEKLNILKTYTINEMKKDEHIKYALLQEYEQDKELIPLNIIN
jgi:hypothetical protein